MIAFTRYPLTDVLPWIAIAAAALWLTVHDPKRRDLRDLRKNERIRRRLR